MAAVEQAHVGSSRCHTLLLILTGDEQEYVSTGFNILGPDACGDTGAIDHATVVDILCNQQSRSNAERM
jgi:hypothetical protein